MIGEEWCLYGGEVACLSLWVLPASNLATGILVMKLHSLGWTDSCVVSLKTDQCTASHQLFLLFLFILLSISFCFCCVYVCVYMLLLYVCVHVFKCTHMPRHMCGCQKTALATISFLAFCPVQDRVSCKFTAADARLAGPQASVGSPAVSLHYIWVLDMHYCIQLFVGSGVQVYPLSHFPRSLPFNSSS